MSAWDWHNCPAWRAHPGTVRLPPKPTDLRSPGSAAAALEEQECRAHTAWNSVCTFAKDTSWAVCRREEKMACMTVFFLQALCCCKFIFYLDVFPILCLQQTLVIGFDAKCEVRAWNDVSPVTSHSHFVPFLSRWNPDLAAVALATYNRSSDIGLPDWRLSMRSRLDWLFGRRPPAFQMPTPSPSTAHTRACWWHHPADSRYKAGNKKKNQKATDTDEFYTHALFVQFHGDIPVEGSALAVVAYPQVLPDPVIPGFGHQSRWRRLRLEPHLEDLGQLISLPKL